MIELRVAGNVKKIFKHGKYQGEFSKTKEGYLWKEDTRQGLVKTEREALLALGYKPEIK